MERGRLARVFIATYRSQLLIRISEIKKWFNLV